MKTTKKDECSYSFSNAIRTLAMSSVVTLEYHQLRFMNALYNFIKCTIFSQAVISREKCTKNVTRKIKLVQNCKN